ncbi:MAG: GntR family transcriptional regulator [Bryobacteraceae bacterium]
MCRNVSRRGYVDPLTSGSLSDRAYELIRNKILKGEFPLGAPLSRRKLASEFQMSFLPISEAVQRLESEGLVESRPRVGTRVRIPTTQDLRDRYIIREALESQAARLFCERATSADRQKLRAEADSFEEMIEVSAEQAADPEFQFSVQTAHVVLHMRIAESSGCMLLCDLLEKNQLLIFNWFYDVAAGYKIEGGRHRELVKILTGNDPDAACLAMGQHVRSGMHEIQAAITARFGTTLSRLNRQPRGSHPVQSSSVLPWRLPNR